MLGHEGRRRVFQVMGAGPDDLETVQVHGSWPVGWYGGDT